MKWFVTHWQMFAWIFGGLFTAIVFAESEYREYRNMQEAVYSQKEFNDAVNTRIDKIHTQQERIDERTQIMMNILKEINRKVEK